MKKKSAFHFAKIIRDRLGDLKAMGDPRGQQKELADLLGIHESQLSRMLRGREWTVQRYHLTMQYLDIDPLTVFQPQGGPELAKIVSVLQGLGDSEKVLEMCRKIHEIHSATGSIDIVIRAVELLHDATIGGCQQKNRRKGDASK